MTHQIPYDSLGVDLHQIVSSDKTLILLSLSKNNKLSKLKKLTPHFYGGKTGLKTVQCYTSQFFFYSNTPFNKLSNKVTGSNRILGINTTSELKQGGLNVIYGANTPLFNKLISILSQGPINKETQIQIETFLNNQGLELSKLPHKNHVPSKLVNFFLEIQPKLTILIENYQKRLKSADLNGLSLKEKIMCNLSSEFLIAIILGCLLQIISNNNIINNKTRTLEVTVALGKDITFKYISECYKYKKK